MSLIQYKINLNSQQLLYIPTNFNTVFGTQIIDPNAAASHSFATNSHLSLMTNNFMCSTRHPHMN